MKRFSVTSMAALGLFALGLVWNGTSLLAQSRPCGCYCGIWLPAPCSDNACKAACGWQNPTPGPGTGGVSEPSIDHEAERRAREEADRQREENERREQERRKAEQQKQFERERDEAAKLLKGNLSTGATGLKGIGPEPSGLRELPMRTDRDLAARQAAQARRAELDKQIERDMEAIRRLGFARRAEDFAEWERLAAKAKAEFEGEVIDTVTDIAVDKARGKILNAFKSFDPAKASRMIAWIKSKNIKPQPAALIAAIERVGRATDKSRIADDAEFIVKQIEDWRKAKAAAGVPIESAKFAAGMLEGLVSDPRLSVLITEIKLTTAALYNNATRRVARAEVNRLTDLTEKQLKDLDRLRQVLQKHVQERNELKKTMEEAEK